MDSPEECSETDELSLRCESPSRADDGSSRGSSGVGLSRSNSENDRPALAKRQRSGRGRPVEHSMNEADFRYKCQLSRGPTWMHSKKSGR